MAGTTPPVIDEGDISVLEAVHGLNAARRIANDCQGVGIRNCQTVAIRTRLPD